MWRLDSTWLYFYLHFLFCFYSHNPFWIQDFSKIHSRFIQKNHYFVHEFHIFSHSERFPSWWFVLHEHPYEFPEWCFIFPKPLSLFCAKNTVEHLIRVWGHHQTDPCSFPVPRAHHFLHLLYSIQIRQIFHSEPGDLSIRDREPYLNICFPSFILHPWVFFHVFALFQSYL